MDSESNQNGEPVRVLHVLGSLNRGGAETWLAQLIRYLDPNRVAFDILIHGRGGVLEPLVRSLGARVHYLEKPTLVPGYKSRLERLMVDSGPFSVVHSHLHFFTGHILEVASGVGVPGRIAHFRNTSDGKLSTPFRKLYRRHMRAKVERYATHILAVSEAAARACTGRREAEVLTGIDLQDFASIPDRAWAREALEIPQGVPVIGHLGSFRTQKNHLHLVRVAKRFLRIKPDALFLLVGDGALRSRVEAQVDREGMRSAFRFLGEASEVAPILAAMDAFILPSLHEGLPRALLEAEAAGLPCVASSAISPEVEVTGAWIRFVSLEAEPQRWVDELEEAVSIGRSAHRGEETLVELRRRGLSIESNARELTALYQSIG